MKLKKAFLSVVACALALIVAFACVACTDDSDPTVESVTLNETTVVLGPNDTFTLKATVVMSDESTGSVDEWTTSDENVATVAKGVVRAKAPGTVTITAKAGDKQATCTVTVENIVVELDQTSITMDRNDAGIQLTATVKKDGVAMSDATIDWTSSDVNVATVDDNGFVSPVGEGSATITATRHGSKQTATCAVEVTWEKPVGYNPIAWAEQNKLEPNTWGYWNAKESSWAGGGLATDYNVYTDETFVESNSTLKDGYEYIGMGRITFEYEITSVGPNYTYQAFYRSSDNVKDGILHYNHVYELTFKIVSSKAGVVHVNPYDDIRTQRADESNEDYAAYLAERQATGKYNPNHDFTLEADVEQTITVVFRHDDCGYVYQEGIYDNMGSALHMQLGDIIDGRVVLSVWDFQFKDLGEAENPVACDETKHAGYVNPDAVAHPADPEVKPVGASTATKAYLTVENNMAVFNIEGTLDLSYFNNSVDEAKTWLLATRFDMQQCGGSWQDHAFNRIDATVGADGSFHIKYDITYLTVDNGGTGAYTCHFTEKETTEDGYGDNKYRDLKLDAESAVPGESITVGNKTYTIVNNVGGTSQAENWGCVSIKVESDGSSTPGTTDIIGINGDPELPEGGAVTATAADIVLENNTVYFVLSGTSTGCTKEQVEAYVNGIYFDFQENGYNNGAWNGSWNEHNTFTRVATVNEDGTWTIKFDITDMPVASLPYTGHFKLNDGSNSDNIGSDLKLADAEDGKSVTLNGKKYSIVNKVGSDDPAVAWGCVALKVENA